MSDASLGTLTFSGRVKEPYTDVYLYRRDGENRTLLASTVSTDGRFVAVGSFALAVKLPAGTDYVFEIDTDGLSDVVSASVSNQDNVLVEFATSATRSKTARTIEPVTVTTNMASTVMGAA